MKKEIFKLIVAEFQKLGINPTQWLGTRTNVRRINKKNLADSSINEYAFNRELESVGKDRLLKLFNEEAKYLGQLNDSQATTLLQNLKTANKVINPPPKPEAGIYQFSKLPGKKLTPDEFTGKKAADEGKIMSAQLNAAMETAKVDQELAKKLNLDMSKVSDFNKLQAWKKKHNVPEFHSTEGIESLFKVTQDNPLADIGTQIDAIEKEGKSLVDQAKKLADQAWEMSPEGIAFRETVRKDINRRSNEGKGFAGGVFGARNDGFFRAVVRPFLLAQHDKGKIKLAENTFKSLKNSDDLKGGGDFMSADPVRVFRQHYGDDAFDLIPDQEAFGMGPTGYGPTTNERISILEKVIKEPIMKVGSDKPGDYLTKGEFQAKLDHEDEVLGYIQRREGRFGDMNDKELADEVTGILKRKATLEDLMNKAYPAKTSPEVSGIDNTLKSDFENITGGLKKTKQRETAIKDLKKEKGQDYTPTENEIEQYIIGRQTALKSDRETILKSSPEDKELWGLSSIKTTKKKDPFGIRLMKNFDQDLTDEGLAQEGYNLQEIDILKRARNVMKDPEKDVRHPTEALRWVRGDMADEAGVDIDEFMTTFNWDDKYAQGGGVGSMFRRV